jgi:nucleoside-diphosphate-sugar epimerase
MLPSNFLALPICSHLLFTVVLASQWPLLMSFNRIAVYGHRGWASSVIVRGLASTGAPIRILYRPGSDISQLPDGVTAVEVDVSDRAALLAAIKDIDIVMCVPIVGQAAAQRQLR